MVGVSGSGKSTFANGLKTSLKLENGRDVVLVETDAIRGELTNDPTDQSKNSEVFSLAQQRVSSALRSGKNAIIDATSVSVKDRKLWVSIGKNTNSEVRAYFINTSLETAKKRNLSRQRVVPDFVIDRQLSRLTKPTTGEGFDKVIVV